jgi:hypothetical protein
MEDGGMSNVRPVQPLNLPQTPRAPVLDIPQPTFAHVAPRELQVDEKYQRALSERSVKLIMKIVEKWDWAQYKPPIVAKVGEAWHVVDGQHTAIAAATHGGFATIPVMIISAIDTESRARAFVGHNQNRLNVTPIQIFHAAVAAGDPDALTVAQVCERARVTLRATPPSDGRYAAGETMSISALRVLVNRRGAMRAREVLDVLVDAKCAPISSDHIKAIEELLLGEHYKGSIKAADLATVIRDAGAVDSEVTQLAMSKRIARWRAMVIVFANRRTRRGSRATD